jgi:hypothetical protein
MLLLDITGRRQRTWDTVPSGSLERPANLGIHNE